MEFEVDEFRKRLQSIKTEKQNQLLVNTSVIQDYQTEIEKMIQNIKLQDDEVLKVDDRKKDISRELSQTIQAIRNLFGRWCIYLWMHAWLCICIYVCMYLCIHQLLCYVYHHYHQSSLIPSLSLLSFRTLLQHNESEAFVRTPQGHRHCDGTTWLWVGYNWWVDDDVDDADGNDGDDDNDDDGDGDNEDCDDYE